MDGDPVPTTDHISRWCRKRTIVEDRITGAAFEHRPIDEYLSVNWLEFLALDSREEEIAEIQRVLNAKLNIHGKDRIAVGNVGEVLEYVRAESLDQRQLSVIHKPLDGDESHSGIFGLRKNEDMLHRELIAEKFQKSYQARIDTTQQST